MRCPPRLRAAFRHLEGRRQVIDILVAILNGKDALVFGANLFLELGLEVLADYEYDLAETGAFGVEHGIVQYGLAGRAHRVYLLQPAVAGSHSCGKNNKCRFHVFIHSFRDSGCAQGSTQGKMYSRIIARKASAVQRITVYTFMRGTWVEAQYGCIIRDNNFHISNQTMKGRKEN